MPAEGRFCSMPDIGNLRKWFEKNFHNACEYHDRLYTDKDKSRLDCDLLLVNYMKTAIKYKDTKSKILVYYPTIGITFLAVRCFGALRYYK